MGLIPAAQETLVGYIEMGRMKQALMGLKQSFNTALPETPFRSPNFKGPQTISSK